MNSKSVRIVSAESIRKGNAIGRADARYWQQAGKLFTNHGSGSYCCKIQFNGRRESFPLATSIKTAAAAKAAKIYGDVSALGWEAALAKHKPESEKILKSATVGEWLDAVERTADLRKDTLTNYAQALRLIIAEIKDIGDQPKLTESGNPKKDRKGRIIYASRFDYRAGGRDAWIAKVHDVPLSILTPAAVQEWKIGYIAKAGKSPDTRRRAENSAASMIRCARSLFSDKCRKYATASLVLPEPLPFEGVELPKKGNTRYQSKINAAELIESARTELKGEPFKIFVLGMLCGLRKREIDLLTWPQIDFDKRLIHIERTAHFAPKSEDSIGEVDVDDELLALLRGWKAEGKGEFVIQSPRSPRHSISRMNYRCEPSFVTLNLWLRKKGITAQKPLHELRKELGALLASSRGIFAAQSVLRHAQISTTAAYYTDKKRRISAGLGALLTAPASNIVAADFNGEKQAANAKQEGAA